MLCCCCDLE
ncbi:hypothetical protein Zm00014a_034267 [Zea mays]|uniref:Uncharacterized protein n=1 Tax=Zea mays TaxID=4577 RepID=A0A317Y2Q4_MAIZE|nr:hypothetical protein Zm00014a_034267 [Zea mays]